MRNYIRADIKRILRNASHLFTMLLVFGIYFSALYFPNRSSQVTSVSLIVSACGIVEWIMLFAGLFEMIAVFSEDFKVKTMQVAIGLGVSRTKVVLCKLIETLILLVLDCIVIVAITLVTGGMMGVTVPMNVLKDLLLFLAIKGLLACAVFISLTMSVLFVTHSTVLSIFTYCFIGMGIINLLVSFMPMFGFAWIEKLNINRITLAYHLGLLHTRVALGGFDLGAFLCIAIHFGVGLFVTCKLFQKRELDF